jgi:hypothetical protein
VRQGVIPPEQFLLVPVRIEYAEWMEPFWLKRMAEHPPRRLPTSLFET